MIGCRSWRDLNHVDVIGLHLLKAIILVATECISSADLQKHADEQRNATGARHSKIYNLCIFMISFQSSVFSYPTFSWYKSIWPFDFTMHPRSLVFHLAKMTTVLPHKHSIQLLNDSDDLIMVVARINFEIALANFFCWFSNLHWKM